MSGSGCVFGRCGELDEKLKVDVPLYAPDVLAQHCSVQHLKTPPSASEGKTRTILRPLHGASVTHNGVPLNGEAELFPGDMVGLGQHYLFMFKDPTAADVQSVPSWMAALCPSVPASPCKNGASCSRSPRIYRRVPACWRDSEGTVLRLSYELQQEDQVLEKILSMADQGGQDPKLLPAFLLCLCVQHSAACFKMEDFCKLLLQLANKIQLAMWVSNIWMRFVTSSVF